MELGLKMRQRMKPKFGRRVGFHVLPSVNIAICQIGFDLLFVNVFWRGVCQQIAVNAVKAFGFCFGVKQNQLMANTILPPSFSNEWIF